MSHFKDGECSYPSCADGKEKYKDNEKKYDSAVI